MPEDASGGKGVADGRQRYACRSTHLEGMADQRVPDKRQQMEACMLDDASGGKHRLGHNEMHTRGCII
jgi:hypothetical protein